MTCQLELRRKEFTDNSTIGELFFNGKFFMYVIEDVVREPGVKVYGQTAIPYGRYKIIINMSNRFKVKMPLLLNVPGFEGVRIHSGNTSADTEGCLIVGYRKDKNFVGNSRKAYQDLMTELKKYEAIEINIVDGRLNA